MKTIIYNQQQLNTNHVLKITWQKRSKNSFFNNSVNCYQPDQVLLHCLRAYHRSRLPVAGGTLHMCGNFVSPLANLFLRWTKKSFGFVFELYLVILVTNITGIFLTSFRYCGLDNKLQHVVQIHPIPVFIKNWRSI